MTVIAYKDGVMAADSCSFRNGRRYASFPKIVRASDGSLAGVSGEMGNANAFKDWFLAGENGQSPKMEGGNDSDFGAVIVRPDGAVWTTYGDGRLIQSADPLEAMGENVAAGFCEAAMLAGLSAEDAVRLTVEHCIYAAGDVQVERLEV